MAFIDEAKFFVKGGDGGRGCVSFRREKYVPKGGPDGGDGGDGGSIYIEASKKLLSLMDFRYRAHFIAQNGGYGQGKKKFGKKGKDSIVNVPLGSIIKDADTNEIIADLTEDGQQFLAARGGKGGGGNVHYASAQNRTPRKAGKGTPGEEWWLKIELKLLADVGLIGMPNAGKSTLLSKLSAANPKIASYPFTTLEPQLGILQLEFDEPCIIADIPGLIEGAHTGAGLGHKFLRHIERTKILLHLIDVGGLDANPLEDFAILENELSKYKDELKSRKRIVILNKIDLLSDSNIIDDLAKEFSKHGLEVVTISALCDQGIEVLKDKIAELMDEVNQ